MSSGSSPRKQLRLFLDSNVLTGGIVTRWGLDKAVLSLCAANICRLVLAEAVKQEVEENLLGHAAGLAESAAQELLDDYLGLIKLARPEIISYPEEVEVLASRKIIAHEADVPVLLSAIKAKPDWLLTHNTKHFNVQVANRTGLKIATPSEFFRQLAIGV